MGLFVPKGWRFLVLNETGVQLDFSTNGANESADAIWTQADSSSGTGNWDSGSTTDSASTDLGTGSFDTLTTHTGEDDLEMLGIFRVQTDNTSASGDVTLLLEASPDADVATTNWPSDAANFDPALGAWVVSIVNLSGAQDKSDNFTFP